MSSLIRYRLVDRSLGSINAQVNDSVINFNYPCKSESVCSPIYVNLSPGRFKIEVWGAQGGSNASIKGGKGGYSSGVISFNRPISLYLYIGGTQTCGFGLPKQNGGYNGGGSGSDNHTNFQGCGGGGGTDFRLNRDDYSSRIIVAGGGGGCGKATYAPGVGGGLEGGNGTVNADKVYSCANEGGKQDSRGRTKKGEDLSQYKYDDSYNAYTYSGFGYGAGWIYTDGTGWPSAGGGGGWFGGGHGCVYSGSGGGGSGYVFSADSIKLPSMKISSRYQFSEPTLQSGSTSYGNEGNGKARITILKEFSEYQCIKTCRNHVTSITSFVCIFLITFMS